MALRFIDSFNHYTSSNIGKKWTTVYSGNSITSGGRSGGNCLQVIASAASNTGVVKTFDNQQHWTVGFGFKSQISGGDRTVVSFWDGADYQCALVILTDNTLQLWNGSLIGSPSAAITSDVWYYIEVKIEISNSVASNSCQVRLNSSTIITLSSGTSTRHNSNNQANQVYLGDFIRSHNGGGLFYCDLYVTDGTSFLGDCSVEAKTVTGAATYTDFTVPGSSTPQGAVSLIDGTYLSSNTTNDRESFSFSSLTGGVAEIKGVQLVAAANKSGSGDRSLKHFVRSGSTNYDQSAIPQGTGFVYSSSILETNPATSVAWTESDVASIEAGVEVV